jgi:hypothetical protein
MFSAQAGEVALQWRGQSLTLVFDFAAIKAFESEGESLFTALDHLQAVAMSDQIDPKTGVRHPVVRPRVTMIAELVSAGLQRHHPEVTPEMALEMVGDAEVWGALFAGYAAAMPSPKTAGGDAADPFPKKKVPAKKPASTGKR